MLESSNRSSTGSNKNKMVISLPSFCYLGEVREKICQSGIRMMCLDIVSCLPADCYIANLHVDNLNQCVSLVQSRILLNLFVLNLKFKLNMQLSLMVFHLFDIYTLASYKVAIFFPAQGMTTSNVEKT